MPFPVYQCVFVFFVIFMTIFGANFVPAMPHCFYSFLKEVSCSYCPVTTFIIKSASTAMSVASGQLFKCNLLSEPPFSCQIISKYLLAFVETYSKIPILFFSKTGIQKIVHMMETRQCCYTKLQDFSIHLGLM